MANKKTIWGMAAIALALGLVLLCVSCQTTPGGSNSGTLSPLLRKASSEVQKWDEGGENERDVTVYSFNPEIQLEELMQAVKDAGYSQTWTGEYTRDWDLPKGVLRWCVPSNTERWDSEIQVSAVDETTVHQYGFRPRPTAPNSDGRPKTISITGYSSPGIKVYTMQLSSESADAPDAWPPAAVAVEEIDGQTVTYRLGLWMQRWEDLEPWTGTGKFFIVIDCAPPLKDSSKDGAKYVYSADGIHATPVDIRDEVTTLDWSKFIWLKDYTAG